MKKEPGTKWADEILEKGKRSEKKPRHSDANGIYNDIIHSLMEKNRKRVKKYYCANSTCPTTFYDAALGYTCPQCGNIGIISIYRDDTASENPQSRNVAGYLDTIGRLFCPECTERYGLTDEISMVIFSDSEPYNEEPCDVCRTPLNKT